MKFHLRPKRNENENRHSSLDEKNENESHLVFIFIFHTFSHQVNPTMRRQYLVQFRFFFAGGPC